MECETSRRSSPSDAGLWKLALLSWLGGKLVCLTHESDGPQPNALALVGNDSAQLPGLDAVVLCDLADPAGSSRRCDDAEADAHVEDAVHLGRGDAPALG